MSDPRPDGDPATDVAAVPGDDDEEAATIRPQWQGDLVLIGKVVLVTYVAFAALGLLAGVSINSIVGTLQNITFYAAVFGLLALALNLHWGYTGLFNIGVAGFMAVGVYVMSFVTAAPDGSPAGLGLPIPVGVVVGMIAAALVGFVAALPALRVRADYFAIVTLGLAEIIRLALLSRSLRQIESGGLSFDGLSVGGVTLVPSFEAIPPGEYGTGGGSGIRAPSTDSVVPWLLERPGMGVLSAPVYDFAGALGIQSSVVNSSIYTIILLGFVVAFYLLLTRIAYSPFGRVLKAIREDELAAKSLGKNTNLAKIKVFMLGCALMGLAGMLWQGSRFNVSPGNFMPIVTFYVFVALIVGGSGSNTGSVIGGFAFAAFLYQGPRFIRTIVRANLDARAPPTIYDAFVELGAADPLPLIGYLIDSLDEIRYILVGVVLIVLMIRKPEGLLGHRKEIAAATDLSRRPAVVDGGRPDSADDGSVGGGSDE